MKSQPLFKLFKTADNWLLAGIAVMAFIFFLQTWNYRTSAAMFPRLVSALVAFFCLYQLFENGLAAWRGKDSTRKKAGPERVVALAWYCVALAITAYLALIVVVGFNIGTLVLMIAFPPFIGYRRWVVIVPTAVILTLVVAYSFGSILHVQLPEGILGSLVGR